jgi:hypothetical protein
MTAIDWPLPQEIEQAGRDRRSHERPDDVWYNDDHLLLGITSPSATNFLLASGWPTKYKRSEQDVGRNGPLQVGQGKETGYDLAAYIREFMPQRNFKHFSVAEVLSARCLCYATFFLSHAQAETWQVTLALMRKIGWGLTVGIWVDYFCLRQCIKDFDPPLIKLAIGEIGNTIAGFSRLHGKEMPEMLTRVWCGYELYCTHAEQATFSMVSCHLSDSLWKSVKIDLSACEATNPKDKETLMDCLEEVGGIDHMNSTLNNILNLMNANFIKLPLGCCSFFVGAAVWIVLACASLLLDWHLVLKALFCGAIMLPIGWFLGALGSPCALFFVLNGCLGDTAATEWKCELWTTLKSRRLANESRDRWTRLKIIMFGMGIPGCALAVFAPMFAYSVEHWSQDAVLVSGLITSGAGCCFLAGLPFCCIGCQSGDLTLLYQSLKKTTLQDLFDFKSGEPDRQQNRLQEQVSLDFGNRVWTGTEIHASEPAQRLRRAGREAQVCPEERETIRV